MKIGAKAIELPFEIRKEIAEAVGHLAVKDQTAAQQGPLTSVDASKARARALATLARTSRELNEAAKATLCDSPLEEAKAATGAAIQDFSIRYAADNAEFGSSVRALLKKYRDIEVPFSKLTEEQRKIVFTEISKLRNTASVHIDARGSRPDIPKLLFNTRRISAGKREDFSISLDISNNGIGPDGAEQLADGLQWSGSKIRHCNLGGNRIGTTGARHLADAFMNSKCQVRDCDLGGNLVGVEGAAYLAEAFENPHCKIERCNLRANQFGVSGAERLARAFQSPNCKIRDCDLSGNQFCDAGVGHLAPALLRFQHCDLRENRISDAGAACIAKIFKDGDSALRNCHLGGNLIGDQGASDLAVALADTECQLDRCDLSNNRFGRERAEELTAVAANRTRPLSISV